MKSIEKWSQQGARRRANCSCTLQRTHTHTNARARCLDTPLSSSFSPWTRRRSSPSCRRPARRWRRWAWGTRRRRGRWWWMRRWSRPTPRGGSWKRPPPRRWQRGRRTGRWSGSARWRRRCPSWTEKETISLRPYAARFGLFEAKKQIIIIKTSRFFWRAMFQWYGHVYTTIVIGL